MKTRIISGAVLAVVGSFCIVMGGPVLLVLLLFASLVGMITTIMLSYTLEPNLYRLYIRIKNRNKK